MFYPKINCYQSVSGSAQPFTFYILSKGDDAGKPCLTPWINCLAIHCANSEELDFYFWLCHSLYQTGRFKPLLRSTNSHLLSINDVRQLLTQVSQSIFPHWQSLQNVIEVLNKLKTTRAHLAQCIISNEKLQNMLLRIHF